MGRNPQACSLIFTTGQNETFARVIERCSSAISLNLQEQSWNATQANANGVAIGHDIGAISSFTPEVLLSKYDDALVP